MSETVSLYLHKAQDFEKMAAEAKDPGQKATFLDLARTYRVLAEHRTESNKDKPK